MIFFIVVDSLVIGCYLETVLDLIFWVQWRLLMVNKTLNTKQKKIFFPFLGKFQYFVFSIPTEDGIF